MPEPSGGLGQSPGLPIEPIDIETPGEQASFAVSEPVATMAKRIDPDPPTLPPLPEILTANNDENGVPPELWPYRDELLHWIDDHNIRSQLLGFLQYTNENTRFNLVAGMGFYHMPEKRIISLDTPEFKQMKESVGMSVGQFVFGAMHEIAHLKTMAELDDAGLQNELEQFEYEKQKKYFARDPNGKPVAMSAQAAYRQFYNISEDAIVNSMVFQHGLFGADVTPFSRQNHQEVVSLYTNRFFPIYLSAAQGQGDYAAVPDQKGRPKIENFGIGGGDVRLANQEDMERGFDWNETADRINRAAQFVTFFMKNQMIGLSPERISSQSEQKEGTHILHDDVALVFTESLSDAYRTLLEKIVAKYQSDPQMYPSTLDLLSRAAYVDFFQDDGKEIVQVPGATRAYVNVTPRGDGQPIDTACTTINVDQAVRLFNRNIGKCLEIMGKESGFEERQEISYLKIFNYLKEIDKSSKLSGTTPLRYNLVNRTHIMRTLLEPIYTMLCILDDSFETKVDEQPPPPPKNDKKDGDDKEKPKGPESKKPITWEVGDRVRHKISNKKGIIKAIFKNADGKVDSVEVEYYEVARNTLAQDTKPVNENLSGDTEVITRPIKDKLIVIQEGDGGESQSGEMDDDYEVEQDKDMKPQSGDVDKNKKPDEDQNPDGEPDEGGEGGDQSENRKPKEAKPDDKEGKKRTKGELEGIISDEEKALKAMIADRNRKRNTKNAENERKTAEYQEKVAKKDRKKRLKGKVQRKEAESGGDLFKPNPRADSNADPTHLKEIDDMIELYMKLEEELHEPIEKMAKAWLEILENISTKIEIVVDKYYRQGKVDPKKLQRLLPEIELGADIERRMIYSRLVEKIKTELRPKMIRALLIVDDSGSMEGEKLKQVLMIAILLCASLRSLRYLFRKRLGQFANSEKDVDVVCDTEIRSFTHGSSRMIMPFQVENFDFLTDPSKQIQRPNLEGVADNQTVAIISAFRRLFGKGGTHDVRIWQDIVGSHRVNPKIKELLQSGYMSEFALQISDGEIEGTDEAVAVIEEFREEFAVATGGLAVGKDEAEAARAQAALENRHNVVLAANDPHQIADKFSEFLKMMVKEQVEKPMLKILEDI